MSAAAGASINGAVGGGGFRKEKSEARAGDWKRKASEREVFRVGRPDGQRRPEWRAGTRRYLWALLDDYDD